MTRGRSPVDVRFYAKVDRGSDRQCWLWVGAKDAEGYGRFGHVAANGERGQLAHRFAYEWFFGSIPEGHEVDHLCSVRACVNPRHLEAVTPFENLRRAGKAGNTHCPKGHALTADNLRANKRTRQCLACHRDRERARYRATHQLRGPRTHCLQGHELTPENLRRDGRHCRVCHNERERERKRRNREEQNGLAR